ncbi:MAG: sulfatase-like hydrolase/transferase [Alphaproteobacteria bacterium]|nr:sulfatase-like hydrolase/transferase [Alphaproteobacteria bacterium]
MRQPFFTKSFLTDIAKFFLCFLLFVLGTMALRCLSSEKLLFKEDWGYVAAFGVLLTALMQQYSYRLKAFWVFLIFLLLYISCALLKPFFSMILSEREIIHTICFSVFLASVILEIQYCRNKTKNFFANLFLNLLSVVLYLLCLIGPFVILSYFIAQHALFSSDIALTLFQTNLSETLSYLSDQNLWLWSVILLAVFVLIFVLVRFFLTIQRPSKFNFFSFLLASFLLFYTGVKILPKLNLHLTANIVCNTIDTLKSFQAYEMSKKERLLHIEKLKNTLTSSNSGIYVLVIGESETRDHMSAYGYERQTTPWLSAVKNNQNTIVFENAYANHTHTVPALTYALSSTNQYNNVDLLSSSSIIEVAKAAGFETYWISNQPKDSVYLTPLSVISNTADHQIWLNTNIGDKLSTEYYDERTAFELSNLQLPEKSFVVVHIMGSHGAYRDRYPAPYNRFKGSQKKLVDSYDNSVLYTDFVLSEIYAAVQENPHFQALVYLSDHGDDADNKLGHESARFTYRMSRIPFVLIASPSLFSSNTAFFETLYQNKNKIWTNDLLYNFLIDLLGIRGLPASETAYSLFSPSYPLTRQNALTLHGQKKLSDEQ